MQFYLQRLPPTGGVLLRGDARRVEGVAGDHLALGAARAVGQVQRLQRHIVVPEEVLQHPDGYEVFTARHLDACICKQKGVCDVTDAVLQQKIRPEC